MKKHLDYGNLLSVKDHLKTAFGKATPPKSDEASFDRWFQGSTVMDAQDQPLVVFHATSTDFDTSVFNPLSHFGSADAADSRSWRQPYGSANRVLPVFLKMSNPLEIGDLDFHKKDYYAQLFKTEGFANTPNPEISKILTAAELKYCFADLEDSGKDKKLFSRFWGKNTPTALAAELEQSDILPAHMKKIENLWIDRMIRVLEAKGYDGFVYKNIGEDKGSTSYIPFRADQIRPALAEPAYKTATPYLKHKTGLKPPCRS